jgi:hypothetical protein
MRISAISPYFHFAHLLLAADCTAFSYANFHPASTRGRVRVIGCPDAYGERFYDKLSEIVRLNDLRTVTLARMDDACRRRMTDAVILAIRRSGKDLPLRMITVFAEGEAIA